MKYRQYYGHHEMELLPRDGGVIKKSSPLVLCITNQVVKELTANVLLAVGASPIMSECKEDIKSFLLSLDGILLNTGGITTERFHFMKDILHIVKEYPIPVVLDPVGCHSSSFRLHYVKELLDSQRINVLKGNSSEIYALWRAYCKDDKRTCIGYESWEYGEHQQYVARGVDGIPIEGMEIICQELAAHFHCIVISTGSIDVCAASSQVYTNSTGHVVMTRITGTGCVLGALITALYGGAYKPSKAYDIDTFKTENCLIDEETILPILSEGLHKYGQCGEKAYAWSGEKLGSFRTSFLDAISEEIW